MKHFYKKITAAAVAVLIVSASFSGCSQTDSSSGENSSSFSETSETTSAGSSGTVFSTVAEALDIDISKYSDIESKADLSTKNIITLNGASAECENNCANINAGDITITKEGTYIFSGTLDDGQITVDLKNDENVYLVLKNADITCKDSSAINIQSSKNTYVIALSNTENTLTDGDSYTSLDDSGEPDACLFSKDDLIVGGGGALTVNANYKDGIKSKDDLIISGNKINVTSADDGIVGKDSVAIVKAESLSVNSQSDGIKSSYDTDTEKGSIGIFDGNISIVSQTDGIQAENSLYIENGSFNIKTGGGSENSSTSNENWGYWGNEQTADTESTSAKALKASYTININDGSFSIDSSDDSIHSNEAVNIASGTFELSSGDDGIHADSNLSINGGTINIRQCYEGIEGSVITIDAGDINVISGDDGINAAGGDGSATDRMGANKFSSGTGEIAINGGYIYVDAQGDGIDSNGNMIISGGTIVVNGPEGSGNTALDFDGSASISGGFLVASGMSQMAEQLSGDSSQNNVMINFTETIPAGELLNISDSTGNSVLTYSPSKSCNSIIFSSSELKSDETYTISTGGSCNGESKNGVYSDGTYSGGSEYDSFTVSSVCTTVGQSSMGQGGMGKGGMNNGAGKPGRMP